MSLQRVGLLGAIILLAASSLGWAQAVEPSRTLPSKTSGTLYPGRLIELAERNAAIDPEMQAARDLIVSRAKPWLDTSD
jgi:hypothetical protein